MTMITNINVVKLYETPKRGHLSTLKRRVRKMHKGTKHGGRNYGRSK